MRTERSAAIITIKKPGKMTDSGRRRIAKWMREQAQFLERYGNKMSDTSFRARYMYR